MKLLEIPVGLEKERDLIKYKMVSLPELKTYLKSSTKDLTFMMVSRICQMRRY